MKLPQEYEWLIKSYCVQSVAVKGCHYFSGNISAFFKQFLISMGAYWIDEAICMKYVNIDQAVSRSWGPEENASKIRW